MDVAMRLHPGRILGIVMGLVILLAVFALPLGEASGGGTLYGMAGPLLANTAMAQTGTPGQIIYNYILILSFVLLVIAGVVGVFPLGTGVLGVVGMALLTIAPYLGFPTSSATIPEGIGFFVIWAASIVSLGAAFWHGPKEKVEVVVQQQPAQM